ncbi:MAG TPA: serine/threonine-protein kinase [Bryobacteraceae bacterium]|nr:serine/threonine-protein kinase [Bryobacteraceae bacterium]
MDRSTPSIAETVAVDPNAASAAADSDVSRLTSASSVAEDDGRFVPGTLLGGRYRVIGLLGRGGMGEVYRATDLTLGQSVALKFLPEEASRNPRLLERFHGEVRVARLVSHPNVCRVYDIGEVEGMPYISMEYVDGEDLASLLTRIGRLPANKALETARKLCAGLNAAHDRGVIHRDLKPQNIMINKRGEVVIMDFGLAAIADQLSGTEVRNGTPAYMAPEQLKGAGVTARSDIYSLGLVLYELFTGRRPYEAKTVHQLLELQDSVQLTNMTSVAADIDPAVEKAIRRCLDPDPMKRPMTALAVSALLPGGDRLAAALEAGETPSPEMVASHGDTEGLARRYSVPLILLVMVGLLGAAFTNQHREAIMHAALEDSPDVLAHLSRELAASFGYPKKPADTAIWVQPRTELIRYMRDYPKPRPWDEMLTAEAPIRSVYRESPNPLYALPTGSVDQDNPPPIVPGMVAVVLDGHGQLLEFSAVPYRDGPDLPQPVDPATVFRAAGLDMATFSETEPTLLPNSASDQIRAWKGPHPKLPHTELKVQIASWRGRITRARVEFPWQTNIANNAGPSLWTRVRQTFYLVLISLGTFLVCLLARRNWKLGRTDRKGALRIAIAQFLLTVLAWVGTVHAVADSDILNLAQWAAADCLLSAALIWLVYLALEPAVRARWPHALVTWNRVLAGRWLDPQVGAHMLIGAAVGCGLWLLISLTTMTLYRDDLYATGSLSYALGTRHWIGGHANMLAIALRSGLLVFLGIFGLRVLVRKDWLAALIAAALFTMQEGEVVNSPDWIPAAVIYVVLFSVLIFALLRFGLVATVAAVYFINSFGAITVGGEWKSWFAPAGLATMLLLLGIAMFAFWRSLGSRELIGNEESVG